MQEHDYEDRKNGGTAAAKNGGCREKCCVCGSEEHFAHKHCGSCKRLEQRTRDCEERDAEKGTMLAKINIPVSSELGLMAAMVRVAHGDCKEEWDSDSDSTFQMSHTRSGLTAYKKASRGMTVKVADGTILPRDGFGTIEVDLDQLDTSTKPPVKMVVVVYVPGHSRNLSKAVEQWGKPLIYYKTTAVLGFPGG